MSQFVKCLECGKEFKVLIKHIICKHNMSIANYRDKHPGCRFDSEDVRTRRWNSTKNAIQQKYGVNNIMQCEVIKNKAENNMRNTFIRKYGVSHPMQSKHVKQLYQDSIMKKYGQTCVMRVNEIQKKQRVQYTQTCLEKYGADNTFSVLSIQKKARVNASVLPNGLETLIIKEFPELLYTGDGKLWIEFQNGKRKNPDFILKNSFKLIEVFGDYWHSFIKTGIDKFSHQQDIVHNYQLAGYDCLVIWESEIKDNFNAVKSKIADFILETRTPETTRRTPQNIVDDDIVRTAWRHAEHNRNDYAVSNVD